MQLAKNLRGTMKNSEGQLVRYFSLNLRIIEFLSPVGVSWPHKWIPQKLKKINEISCVFL